MQISSRFTMAIHMFACIDTFSGQKMTSDFMAGSIGTNPVIIRKLLQQLKAAGLVEVSRGTGGVTVTRPLDKITFLDIYKAVECNPDETLFHFHENPNPKCPVGRNIHNALDSKLAQVQAAMEQKLSEITLADVKNDVAACIEKEWSGFINQDDMNMELEIALQDTQWPFEYVDHERNIARAVVYDESGQFYFVRAERDDIFGKATLIETSGGGVENGEDLISAIKRELKEELGVQVEVICKIGVVSDYYNLIHRHNINNYFLCKVKSFSEKNLTQDEIENFHLSTLKLSYKEAVQEYENRANTKLGKLIVNRELPVLHRAKEIIDERF